MMSRRFPVLLACLLAVACSDGRAPLVASDIEIKWPLPGSNMSAGYLVLANRGEDPITITGITSPQFASVELHETIEEDGISRMVELAALTIPPASQIELEPGGKHLMLINPRGDPGPVQLEFHSGDTVILSIEVRPAE
jgi:copper(I)-binding protein